MSGLVEPTFLADQRHEHHATDVFLLELVGADNGDAKEALLSPIADRDYQSPADLQLLLKRHGNGGSAGGDEDDTSNGAFSGQPFVPSLTLMKTFR